MTIYRVKKRNGAIVSFDRERIISAIKKAVAAVGGDNFNNLDFLVDTVVNLVEEKTQGEIPDVELIQDKVEEILIKNGHDSVAKSYILYRQKRAEARDKKSVVIEVGKTMEEYLGRTDWRVNANANSGYSLGGLILNTSGKITANYWLSHIYPTEIGTAHRNGDMHIHDLDMFCGYCAGWSLRALLEEGFNGGSNRVESSPPKNLQSAVNQMINFFGTLQNEWAGAQAFSSFDTYLSPFVHKYSKNLEKEMETYDFSFADEAQKTKYIEEKTYKYVLQNLQNFVFGLNVPSRWGTQTPFTNITLDWVCPDDLKDKALHLGGYSVGPYEKTFGELTKERKLINRALVEVFVQGDWRGRVFTFPIPTYNITEDFDWDDPELDGVFEMTAKYGIPYFQNFVGSQFKVIKDKMGNTIKIKNEDAYTPGAVRSMCCRLQLDLRELLKRGNGLFGSAEMTGSIGVVTVNLARIGYNYAGDTEGFRKQIKYLMDLAKSSLEIKRKELSKWMDNWLYPYTYRYLKSFRNHFSTIGLNGMNEAVLNFTKGQHDITSEEGRQFALETLEFMRNVLKSYQEETGNLYNLEATPAEGTTHRFAKEDKKFLKWIIQAGTDDAPYYTNSSQLPVTYTEDVFEALEHQNDLQCKYTWGTVFHVYVGERLDNASACKSLVRKIFENYQLPYITISPTFSICPKHGYVRGEHDFCPRCDEEIGYTGPVYDVEYREKYTANPDRLDDFKAKNTDAPQ